MQYFRAVRAHVDVQAGAPSQTLHSVLSAALAISLKVLHFHRNITGAISKVDKVLIGQDLYSNYIMFYST